MTEGACLLFFCETCVCKWWTAEAQALGGRGGPRRHRVRRAAVRGNGAPALLGSLLAPTSRLRKVNQRADLERSRGVHTDRWVKRNRSPPVRSLCRVLCGCGRRLAGVVLQQGCVEQVFLFFLTVCRPEVVRHSESLDGGELVLRHEVAQHALLLCAEACWLAPNT